MLVEIEAPACLPLGIVRVQERERATTCLMGVALNYPPVQLGAAPGPELIVSGARAPKAYEFAERHLQAHPGWLPAEIDVDRAIPDFVGLSSDAMLALSVAQALAAVNRQRLEHPGVLARILGLTAADALAVWAFHAGGLLFVELPGEGCQAFPTIVRRHEIAHDPQDEWVWVLYLPRPPAGIPADLERERLDRLLTVCPAATAAEPMETGRDMLWALEQADAAAFGQALLRVQSRVARDRDATSETLSSNKQDVLNLLQGQGAAAWGQSPTGMGIYGLVKGAHASLAARDALRNLVGFYRGTVTASDTNNRGVRMAISDTNLEERRQR